jgi:hypothetical protein
VTSRHLRLWLGLCAAAGVALAGLYPDSYQQDGGYHYLYARWVWVHRELLVGVWSRPLFTLVYSLPASFGYPAAKLFSLALCLVTAYQTVRLAEASGLARAPLAALLLFLQPAFLLLSTDTMTEPLFALLFAVALRLHAAGRVRAGMVVASLLILARPEGFFVGALWGLWVLFDRRDARPWWRRVPDTLWLATGAVFWWLAAWGLTGDPLFIPHDWPPGWEATSASYGVGPVWSYVVKLPEIAGSLLVVPFLAGLAVLLARRRLPAITSSIAMLFAVHSALRAFGWFGAAGYPRYFVCIAPAIALATLAGWNALSDGLARFLPALRRPLGAATLALSAILALAYVDTSNVDGRDARAATEMAGWLAAHPRPISRLVWSQAYMDVLLDRDPLEAPRLGGERRANLEVLRRAAPGTLVFWDAKTGPAAYGLTAREIEDLGYERLRSRSYTLSGWLPEGLWWASSRPRRQQMYLLYKSRQGAPGPAAGDAGLSPAERAGTKRTSNSLGQSLPVT